MKGELLNFLKSALKLGPENGEWGIEMKSTFSNGGNSCDDGDDNDDNDDNDDDDELYLVEAPPISC